jgi:3-isopropylmalate dehydrogenase|tara:strand:- start:7015 stop:8100 length:1086 start_codon:yes stop_codon:yes gene_type:complete
MAAKKILILKGDCIGPEIVNEAVKVLHKVAEVYSLNIDLTEALIGGSAYDLTGDPCPEITIKKANECDAILMGSVGGPKWDRLERASRPETGLLKLRSSLEFFGNLRPAILYPQLVDASSLKPEVVSGLNLLIVRELTGGIYFGEPRGIRTLANGEREGFNTYKYSESEIYRIGRLAFDAAMLRSKRVCSVDKANVLEATILWREIMDDISTDYPEVDLSHMYVDNAAMQLVKEPKQFDVIVTGNMFGDILSDVAAMLTGSIGMLPSAALDKDSKGLYEPCHGSAPDIAGLGIANPLATILSVSMMLRYSLSEPKAANSIERAVNDVLNSGLRTPDIGIKDEKLTTTSEMGNAVVAAIKKD